MLYLDTPQWVEHLSLEVFHSALDTEMSSGVFKGQISHFVSPSLRWSWRCAWAPSSRLAGERRSSQLSLKCCDAQSDVISALAAKSKLEKLGQEILGKEKTGIRVFF